MAEKVSLVIQAGGRSLRMGEDKALKPFLGKPLILQVLSALSGVGDEVLVTSNQMSPADLPGLRLEPDLLPGRGTLGGLYTAMVKAVHPLVAVVACDLPFASADIFKEAIRLLQDREVDAVVPRSLAGLEPMHAVYRRSTCLPVIQAALIGERLKAIDWFSRVRMLELDPDALHKLDPEGLAFWNVNTPEEFKQAEVVARQRKDLAG